MTLLTAGTAAAAGTPFTLDGRASASDPAVAVDENGVGHFAWEENVPYVSQQQPGPDILRYCQVPRNGTGCTKPAQFTLGNDAFHAPRVLLPADGRVLILAHRCCGDALWLVESLDGGSSWGAPRAVGTVEPSGDAEYGPGAFSVSVITSVVTGATFFQAAPLDGFTTGRANVGEQGRGINNPFAHGDLAFENPLTPIVVMTDLEKIYFREWGGVGDYNDLGTWGSLQEYGAGDQTQLVGGKRGVFMTYKTDSFPRQYRMARWGGMSFGSQSDSTPVTPKGDPIFGDLFQDRGGNLHFLWQENGPDELRHRMSRDGETWKRAETLADSSDGGLFNLAHATARDGGGFAVWDENGGGPVKAVQFGPTGPVKDLPEDESCVLELKVGAAEILARKGCLEKKPGTKKYVTKGDVRVNGIDLQTAAGGSARAAAKATIVIDKAARTLVTEGKVEARVGNVVLDRSALSWKLPAKAGQITDLAGNPAVFDTQKLGKVEFLKLPVSGQTSPKLTKSGGVEMPVNLKLPPPFSGLMGLGDITGNATLRADNSGLKLSNLFVRGENIGLGIAEIDDLVLEYVDDPWQLNGSATLVLPVIQGEISGTFELLNGAFSFGSLDWNAKPFEQGIPVATGAYLRHLGVKVDTDPTRVAGTAAVAGLGTFAGIPVLEIGGTASYTFTDPGVFRIDAAAKLIGVHVADAWLRYETPSTVTFAGSFELGDTGVLGIKGSAGGGFSLKQQKFDLFGDAEGCAFDFCAGASWIVSSKAAAICITEPVSGGIADAVGADEPATATVAYSWKSGIDAWWGCNLGKYKAVSSAHAAQDGSRTFRVARGAPILGIEVVGQGAPPRVTITGPGGQTLSSLADQSELVSTEVGVLAADSPDAVTAVALHAPQAGTWTVEPQQGSVPIIGLRKAESIPPPRVKAKVRGKRYRRTLSYTVRPIPGQRVRFLEQSARAFAPLGVAKGRRGKIAFTPASGARGKRSVVAVVEQDGVPRKRIVAASYKAPGLIRPGRPRKLRVVRRRGGVVVRWRRAARARSYIVRAKLRDGRRLTIPSRRRRLRIRNVPGVDSGRIWVYGVTRDQTVGPAKQAKLKAKPKKLKKKRRRR